MKFDVDLYLALLRTKGTVAERRRAVRRAEDYRRAHARWIYSQYQFQDEVDAELIREVPWKYGIGQSVLQAEYPDGRYLDERL